jgi:hypothetical protein
VRSSRHGFPLETNQRSLFSPFCRRLQTPASANGGILERLGQFPLMYKRMVVQEVEVIWAERSWKVHLLVDYLAKCRRPNVAGHMQPTPIVLFAERSWKVHLFLVDSLAKWAICNRTFWHTLPAPKYVYSFFQKAKSRIERKTPPRMPWRDFHHVSISSKVFQGSRGFRLVCLKRKWQQKSCLEGGWALWKQGKVGVPICCLLRTAQQHFYRARHCQLSRRREAPWIGVLFVVIFESCEDASFSFQRSRLWSIDMHMVMFPKAGRELG